jgi:hypothetical protein
MWEGEQTHALFKQKVALPQALPHAPQLSRSLVLSTHSDPHRLVGAAQPHAPLMQAIPVAHETPQVPQLLRSAIRSTHAPAHRVFGLWHRDAHAPPLQTRPGGREGRNVAHFGIGALIACATAISRSDCSMKPAVTALSAVCVYFCT